MKNAKQPLRLNLENIQEITGASIGACRGMLQQIRIANGKLKRSSITVAEFCTYTGIEPALVMQIVRSNLNDKKL